MDFKIEKGVPISVQKYNSTIYPWRELEIGDSFLAEKPASFHSMAKQVGIKVKVRKQADGTIRIWRVE